MSLQLNSIYWDATWKNKVIELLIQLYVLSLNRLPFYLIFCVNNLKPLEVKHIKSGNEMYTSWISNISRDWMIVIPWNSWILWHKGNNTFNLKVALFHKKFQSAVCMWFLTLLIQIACWLACDPFPELTLRLFLLTLKANYRNECAHLVMFREE